MAGENIDQNITELNTKKESVNQTLQAANAFYKDEVLDADSNPEVWSQKDYEIIKPRLLSVKDRLLVCDRAITEFKNKYRGQLSPIQKQQVTAIIEAYNELFDKYNTLKELFKKQVDSYEQDKVYRSKLLPFSLESLATIPDLTGKYSYRNIPLTIEPSPNNKDQYILRKFGDYNLYGEVGFEDLPRISNLHERFGNSLCGLTKGNNTFGFWLSGVGGIYFNNPGLENSNTFITFTKVQPPIIINIGPRRDLDNQLKNPSNILSQLQQLLQSHYHITKPVTIGQYGEITIDGIVIKEAKTITSFAQNKEKETHDYIIKTLFKNYPAAENMYNSLASKYLINVNEQRDIVIESNIDKGIYLMVGADRTIRFDNGSKRTPPYQDPSTVERLLNFMTIIANKKTSYESIGGMNGYLCFDDTGGNHQTIEFQTDGSNDTLTLGSETEAFVNSLIEAEGLLVYWWYGGKVVGNGAQDLQKSEILTGRFRGLNEFYMANSSLLDNKITAAYNYCDSMYYDLVTENPGSAFYLANYKIYFANNGGGDVDMEGTLGLNINAFSFPAGVQAAHVKRQYVLRGLIRKWQEKYYRPGEVID